MKKNLLGYGTAFAILLSVTNVGWAAQPNDSDLPQNQEFSSGLMNTFQGYCIDNFLNRSGDEQLARSKNAVDMSKDDVQQFLKKDPGHGWLQEENKNSYIITVEEPPIEACAVRTFMNGRKFDLAIFEKKVKSYSDGKGWSAAKIPNKEFINDQDKTRSLAMPFVLFSTQGEKKTPQETFIIILTTKIEKSSDPAELRLVHQKIPGSDATKI